MAAVMALAVGMAIALYSMYRSSSEELDRLTGQLEVSRGTWERIAEEKEELQEELKTVGNDLKEAKLTLSESTSRAAELKDENAKLKNEIEELKKKTGAV